MNTESIYWLFSSAAQSIAGLIGFRMAGIALAFSMMDRLADEDDTLREVIHSLKTRYHRAMAAQERRKEFLTLSGLRRRS